MICKKCNTLNSNDAKACVNCGLKLSVAPQKNDAKPSLAKPSTNKFASQPKQKPAKQNVPGSKEKKSKLGVMLLILLIVILGGGYFLVNTSPGQKYLEEAKKHEMIGEYVSLADSLLKFYISEFMPETETIEEKKIDSEESEKPVAKPLVDEPKKPVINRIKRDMLYYTSLKDNMNMVLIPGGKVTIGSNSESENEKPVHEVMLKQFYIDEHEVTNSQFRIFVEETGYKLPRHILFDRFNGPRQPIVGVSHEDAQAYAKWAGKRLPTEYEWEKAARGGLEELRYPYSNEIDPTMACYDLNPANDGPADVKGYEPNDYKLYDMDGNVSEWTSSAAEAYPGGRLTSSFSEEYRVIRGGSWREIRSGLTVSKRDFKAKTWTSNGVGFRCVMDY